MAGAPQKPGPYLRSGAVAIAEPTEIEEEIAIKYQAICRDAAEESITIYEAANCGPTEELKNGLRTNYWWKWIVLLAIHAVSQWQHWIPTDLDGAVLVGRVCGTLATSSGGLGVRRTAIQSTYRSVPSESSAASRGPKQAVLFHLEHETTVHVFNPDPASRERVFNRHGESFFISYLPDGLNRRCHIPSVVPKHRRKRSDLRCPGGGIRVGPEMVVEAPGANRIPKAQYLGSIAGISETSYRCCS